MPRITNVLTPRRRGGENATHVVGPVRLLFHPVIQPGEGAAAFLFRVARSNGTTLSKLKELGIAFNPSIFEVALSWDRVRPSLDTLRHVARLVKLRRSAPRAWIDSGVRCCPLCLSEQEYWREEWEVRQYLACTRHNCWLIDRCSVCNEKISWERATLQRCDCGAKFTEASVTSAPEKFVDLAMLVAGKLHDHRPAPTPFGAIQLKETFELVMQFMRRDVTEKLSNPAHARLLDTMETAVLALEPAAGVFSKWPSGYIAYLQAMHNERGDATASIVSTFAGIYPYLLTNRRKDGFEPLVTHFQQYLIEHWPWPVLERGNELVDSIASHVSWIWATVAARLLDVKERKIIELAKQGVIQIKSRPSTTRRVLQAVRREDLPKMRSVLDDQAKSREVRSLGISARRQLVLVPLLFPEAEFMGSPVGWRISQARVRSVMEIAEGQPIVDAESESQVALSRILRSCRWPNEIVERLFRLILSGEVRIEAVLRNKPGFTGWLFDRNVLASVQKGNLAGDT